jgi:signal transduction histidine kinase
VAAALAIADAAVGACLVGASVVASTRRPESRVGALLGLSGVAWFAGSIFSGALYLHRGPLVHLHLAYPTGRLRGWPSRVTVGIAYATAAVRPWANNDAVTIVVALLVAATAASVFLPTLGPTRRALLPALAAALAFAAILGVAALQRIVGWQITDAVAWTYDAVVVGVAVVLLTDLLRGRWAQAVVSGLVVDLGGQSGTGGLRGALARALGDRSLVVGYWLPDERRYVDDAGATVDVGELQPGRSATPIEQAGEPLAVLVHDAAVLDDRDHVEAVTAAARLAVSSARLQAQAYARIDQVAASRRRIVEAADAQRNRLERELRYGPQTQLTRVAEMLATADGLATGPTAVRLAALADELCRARTELDELAHGIHPRALVDGGLALALPKLADLAGIPVQLDIEVGRLPGALEAAIYFLCSEAVTNTAKHAHASALNIAVTRTTTEVVAVIADDGLGDADPNRGSGLRGLADRVETLGGTLSIDSAAGRGTRLRAALPLDADENAADSVTQLGPRV